MTVVEKPDMVAGAKEAGLRYVDDRRPGITRRKRGRHFAYFYPDDKPVRDEAELARIKALAVPPAYSNVWISPIANGYLQATGRDARGRKQYRYHQRFREVRDETKYHRLVPFGRALPAIRTAIAGDLVGSELSRRMVLAALVDLLDMTGIRIGNEEYARANQSYGLTTLRARQVSLRGSEVRLQFRGKEGKEQRILLDDKRLARIIRQCLDLAGEELFEYVHDGAVHGVTSDDVNTYLREIAGDHFSAKDFRTWIGTVECVRALGKPAARLAEAKRNIVAALEHVAQCLGNTPAVAKKAYVHPAVLETYLEYWRLPSTRRAKSNANGLSREERFTLAFVEGWERRRSEPLDRTLARSLKAARGERRAPRGALARR